MNTKTQIKTTAAETIALMEGQTLYELYVRRLMEANVDRAWPLGDSTLENVRPDTPLKWKDLSPMRKGFWQQLAQDFLKVAS